MSLCALVHVCLFASLYKAQMIGSDSHFCASMTCQQHLHINTGEAVDTTDLMSTLEHVKIKQGGSTVRLFLFLFLPPDRLTFVRQICLCKIWLWWIELDVKPAIYAAGKFFSSPIYLICLWTGGNGNICLKAPKIYGSKSSKRPQLTLGSVKQQ